MYTKRGREVSSEERGNSKSYCSVSAIAHFKSCNEGQIPRLRCSLSEPQNYTEQSLDKFWYDTNNFEWGTCSEIVADFS